MEKTKGTKIRLGAFVTAGVVLFIAAIYFIGDKQQLFGSTFHVCGIFKDVSGLQIGNNVRFSGINVGVVDGLEQITDSTVKVNMKIANHTQKFIKKNARAIIGSDGLMGSKIVVIIPGAPGGQQVANNDLLATTQPVSIDEILVKIKETSTNAASITEDLADMIDNIHQGRGTIGKLFMDTAFAQNIDHTIVNLKQGTGGFKKNMDAASHSFLLRGFLKRKERRKNRDKENNNE